MAIYGSNRTRPYLARIIIEIYANPLLREHLVFRGGTALHKLFLSPAGRYSEDVDLVQIHAGPIGLLLEELRKTLSPWLGKPKWKLSEGRATLYYRFTAEEPVAQTMRVKIEINTREHFHQHWDSLQKLKRNAPRFRNEQRTVNDCFR